MSTLGRLTNSFLSATNENTLALASLNFDFALIKFNAPKEFTALGEALSVQRRSDAEEGPTHRTARRLGALFEQIIPPTPQLIKAYGLRVSEIINTPGISPRGSRRDGPFEAFVGADGTSIWAAATSGRATSIVHAPLALHLLACMLARAWDAQEATSIWVELVSERQKEIEAAATDVDQLSAPYMAARQKISRKSLAMWDASARSWLRSADETKTSEQTRLMLILKNINISVSGGNSTYNKVVEAWRQAMIGMEKLISGMPQQISDGAILLALSAWYLFPDLVVLGKQTVNVKFADPLISGGGVITIGLQPVDADIAPGIQWSLALSHLRYYGDAVEVNTNGGCSRVTMKQLLLVVFGSVLSDWGVDQEAAVDVAKWFHSVWEFLEGPGTEDNQPSLAEQFSWLHILVTAGAHVIDCVNEDSETCSMLLKWGRRRAKGLLGDQRTKHMPFFGLCNPSILTAMTEQDSLECGIQYLRDFAQHRQLGSGDAVICYREVRNFSWYCEYATAIPHLKASQKRSQDGSIKPEKVHCRWLVWAPIRGDDLLPTRCACLEYCSSTGCRCARAGDGCNLLCHHGESRKCQTYGFSFDERCTLVVGRGEQCQYQTNRDVSFPSVKVQSTTPSAAGQVEIQMPADHFMWNNPPTLFHNHNNMIQDVEDCPSLVGAAWPCRCFDPCLRPTKNLHHVRFHLIKGRANGLGLFVRLKEDGKLEEEFIRPSILASENSKLTPIDSAKRFTDGTIDRQSTLRYLQSLTRRGPFRYTSNNPLETIIDQSSLANSYEKSLEALAIASHVYQSLSGATIPLRIASFPLHTSHWLPEYMGPIVNEFRMSGSDDGEGGGNLPIKPYKPRNPDGETDHEPRNPFEAMTRPRIFACIAMFESGYHNIEPSFLDPVMAMSSANSIFVTSELLSDPYEQTKSRIRRIIGNVGRAGITMMVAPQILRKRPLSDDYRVVAHASYDGKREDNFQGTSLHLSFTDWKLPLSTGSRGTVDEAVFFIESVISVYDQGRWVADLDILNIDWEFVERVTHKCSCLTLSDEVPTKTFTSIDSWEELMDPPENIGIFRAHGNWAARLAALSMLTTENTYVVDPDGKMCARCLKEVLRDDISEGEIVVID